MRGCWRRGGQPGTGRPPFALVPATSASCPPPAEVDLCIKKVNEGVAEWDGLWDKLEETEVGGRVGASAARRGPPASRPSSQQQLTLYHLCARLCMVQDASQRDKIVNEMKKELKKLQRLREQVSSSPR